MNLLIYPTEYAKSGLEFTKYLKAPTMLLNFVASNVGAELYLLSLSLDSMGVSLGLHPVRPALSRIFAA
jgi:hypothetical protein